MTTPFFCCSSLKPCSHYFNTPHPICHPTFKRYEEFEEFSPTDVYTNLTYYGVSRGYDTKTGCMTQQKIEKISSNRSFVVVQEKDKIIKVFYSESGKNAIQQLINYLNNDCQN